MGKNHSRHGEVMMNLMLKIAQKTVAFICAGIALACAQLVYAQVPEKVALRF